MSNLQEVFIRIRENKKEQKKLKDAYRDAVANSSALKEVVEDLKELKEKKQRIEGDLKAQFSSEFTRLEDMKIDLESDIEMLSDLALNQLMKGESIKVKDENDTEYDPVFKVNFKKAA